MDLPRVRPMLYDARGMPLLRSPNLTVREPGIFQWAFLQRMAAPARAKPAGAADAAGDADLAPPQCGPPARIQLAEPTVTREIEIPFAFAHAPAPAQ